MPTTIKVSLPTIDATIKTLEDNGQLGILLAGAASVVVGEVKKRWTGSRGADNESFSPLSDGYKKFKEKKNGRTKADMQLSGEMIKSFGVKEIKGREATATFRADQLKKARGNAYYRPNMLDNNDEPKLTALAVKAFNQLLRKLGKF